MNGSNYLGNKTNFINYNNRVYGFAGPYIFQL